VSIFDARELITQGIKLKVVLARTIFAVRVLYKKEIAKVSLKHAHRSSQKYILTTKKGN